MHSVNKRESKNCALGIDIGGTTIKSGIVDINTGKILNKTFSLPTPNSGKPASVIKTIKDIKDHFMWVGNVGCGFPGVIKNNKVLTAANLSSEWIGLDFNKLLSKIFNNEISIINDADAAGVAEINFGNGNNWKSNNYSLILVITLGTGIGSSLFYKGRLIPNTEFGHINMDGDSAEKYAATVIKESANLSWKEWGSRVNRYLKYMYKILSPDCIILGGGISENPELFFKYLNVNCNILPAMTGKGAGIIGAAANI